MAIKVLKTIFVLCMLMLCCQLNAGVFAQNGGEKAVAERGDGIYTLLQRNGLDPGVHTTRFIELNQDVLNKNNILFEGTVYTLPPANPEESNVVEYPIFGERYAKVTFKDQKLKGAVYYLLAGHGGPDPGAVTKYGRYTISEDEYAYDVTLRLARRLIEHGARVYMVVRSDDGIRDESILAMSPDEVAYPDLTIPANHMMRLKQRTDIVNNLYAKHQHQGAFQRMIAVHIDSRSHGENIDVFFYHHRRSRSGERLANHIHQTFNEKYALHQPGRKYDGTVIHRSGLYVVRHTTPPAVFIELGNIRNSRDQLRFILQNNRQALANWIAEGIIADFQEREQ